MIAKHFPSRVQVESDSVDSEVGSIFVISAIAPSSRRAGRWNITVNQSENFLLSDDDVLRLVIKVGADVTAKHDQLVNAANRVRVYDRALDMLAFRSRSSMELARALVRKGFDRAMVDGVVAQLEATGLLDDARFAESFARSKLLGGKQSRRRVQQLLARKGVGRGVSDEAINAVIATEEIDQSAIIMEAASKKLRGLMELEPVVRRRRLFGFLARRGYDSEDIRGVMSRLAADLPSPAD